MARQTVHVTEGLGAGWSATLTDISRYGDTVEAWFAIGKGDGPFYAYVPHENSGHLAKVVMEPQYRLAEKQLTNVMEGRTFLASVPDSGQDKANEQALLAETGLTVEDLLNKLGEMVTEAIYQVA